MPMQLQTFLPRTDCTSGKQRAVHQEKPWLPDRFPFRRCSCCPMQWPSSLSPTIKPVKHLGPCQSSHTSHPVGSISSTEITGFFSL
uniref:Uncharacterized protein n=1 Tax=Salix viminalis TaxID=40686 RepID=A0A6N2NBZ2_SALVM